MECAPDGVAARDAMHRRQSAAARAVVQGSAQSGGLGVACLPDAVQAAAIARHHEPRRCKRVLSKRPGGDAIFAAHRRISLSHPDRDGSGEARGAQWVIAAPSDGGDRRPGGRSLCGAARGSVRRRGRPADRRGLRRRRRSLRRDRKRPGLGVLQTCLGRCAGRRLVLPRCRSRPTALRLRDRNAGPDRQRAGARACTAAGPK